MSRGGLRGEGVVHADGIIPTIDAGLPGPPDEAGLQQEQQRDDLSGDEDVDVGLSEKTDRADEATEKAKKKRKLTTVLRYVLGGCLVILTAVIWVSSGYLIQLVYSNDSSDHHSKFRKPFFLTYYSTSLFGVYLVGLPVIPKWRRGLIGAIGWVCCGVRRWAWSGKEKTKKEDEGVINIQRGEDKYVVEKDKLLASSSRSVMMVSKPDATTVRRKRSIDVGHVVSSAMMLAPLWFFSNYTYNVALSLTSLSSATIISSLSSMFGFFLGVGVTRTERFSFTRLACVGCVITGVAMISLEDTEQGKSAAVARNPLLGNFLAMFSSFLYGVYTTVMKLRCPDEKTEAEFSTILLFAFIGILNAVLLAPLFPLLNFLGWERFELPGLSTFGFLTLNGFIGSVISDVVWGLSVILTNSVVALIGLSLTIPLSLVVDLSRGHKKLQSVGMAILYFGGALLVFGGFLVSNISYLFSGRLKRCDEGVCMFHAIRRKCCGLHCPRSVDAFFCKCCEEAKEK